MEPTLQIPEAWAWSGGLGLEQWTTRLAFFLYKQFFFKRFRGLCVKPGVPMHVYVLYHTQPPQRLLDSSLLTRLIKPRPL